MSARIRTHLRICSLQTPKSYPTYDQSKRKYDWYAYEKWSLSLDILSAVSKDGIILGRSINGKIDGGAYFTNNFTNSDGILDAIGTKAFRLYTIHNQDFHGKTYYTNTTPGGSCRGYGSPQLHALTEINIDHIANELNMDPCDLRLKNLVKENANDPIGGPSIGNGKIRQCVTEGMDKFNWKTKRKNIKTQNTERFRFGVGMACGVHSNGYKGSSPDFTNIDIRLSKQMVM